MIELGRGMIFPDSWAFGEPPGYEIDYRAAGYVVVAKALKTIATDESVTLTAPNGSSIVVNTPQGRLSVIAGGLDALITDLEKQVDRDEAPGA